VIRFCSPDLQVVSRTAVFPFIFIYLRNFLCVASSGNMLSE
jgi:hypothetical protein